MKTFKGFALSVLVSTLGIGSMAQAQGFYDSAEIGYLGSRMTGEMIPGFIPSTVDDLGNLPFGGYGPKTIGVVNPVGPLQIGRSLPANLAGQYITMTFQTPESTRGLVDAYYIDVGTIVIGGYPQGDIVSQLVEVGTPYGLPQNSTGCGFSFLLPNAPHMHIRIWTHFRGSDWQSKFYTLNIK